MKSQTCARLLGWMASWMVAVTGLVSAQEPVWESSGGPYGGYVNTLVSDGTTLYAGTGSGLFRSENSGKDWTRAGLREENIQCAMVEGNTIYAGLADNGIARSQDSGRTWTVLYLGQPEITVGSIVRSGAVLFAVTLRQGVLRSRDLGNTWTPVNVGLPTLAVGALAVFRGSVYVGTFESGIYKSANDGDGWLPVNAGFLGAPVTCFLATSDTLHVGTFGDGVYELDSVAQFWIPKRGGLANPLILSISMNDATVYAGTFGSGVYRFDAGAGIWTPTGNALDRLIVNNVCTVNGSLFAATSGRGVFRLESSQTAWTQMNRGLKATGAISDFAVSNNIIHVATNAMTFRSVDNGVTWEETGLFAVNAIAASGSTLYAAKISGGVHKSLDAGTTWTEVGLGDIPVGTVVTAGTTVYAGTAAGVYSSFTAGATWVGRGLQDQGIYALELTDTAIYAGTANGVYRSSDLGNSWIHFGLPGILVTSFSVIDGVLYTGTLTGLFRHDFTTGAWTKTGPLSAPVWSLTASGSTLYIATFGAGVFRFEPGKDAWTAMNRGLDTYDIVSIAAINRTLYVGTVDDGIYRTVLNQAPIAVAANVITTEDMPKSVILSGTDADQDALTFTIVQEPANGKITLAGDVATYTPNADYNGPDSFTYVVNDGRMDGLPVTVDVAVAAVNDKPTVSAQEAVTDEDKTANILLIGRDVDGNSLTYHVGSQPSQGKITVEGANATYTPNANYHGSDVFTFFVNDGTLDSDPATVTITVNSVNDKPAATGQTVTTLEEKSVELTLAGEDVDSNPLTVKIVSQPSNGTLAQVGVQVTYVPASDFHGEDTFTFVVHDGLLDSDAATVTIAVTDVNDKPTLTPTSVTTSEDKPVEIPLSGKDSDGNSLTFRIATPPANGKATLTGTAVAYVPNANYNGTDTLTVVANDGIEDSDPITVTITVTPVNDRPTVLAQTVTTAEDTPVQIRVSGADADNDTLTFKIAKEPTHGKVVFAGAEVTYTPESDFHGDDAFSVTASDGKEESDPSVVTLKVTSVNDAPGAQAQSVEGERNTPIVITLEGSDVDADALTFRIVREPSQGKVTVTGAVAVYTPNRNAKGDDSFDFVANDGTADSALAVVNIHVKLSVPWDVDGNSLTDIVDLVMVAAQFGQTGVGLAEDINEDGAVNIVDLVLIAVHFGEASSPAAPPLQMPGMQDTPFLTQWLRDARKADDGSEKFRRGIAMLEHLLNSIVPENTRILPNFPNPFNPETWIPFQLHDDSDVTVTIYDAQGRRVRELALGRLQAGIYHSRERAAYWDGRNDIGERAASGMYFYELRAGSFRAMRRMLVVK